MATSRKPNNQVQKPCEFETIKVGRNKTCSETQRGCLIFVSSAGQVDKERSFRLEQGQAIVGRDEDCDLTIDDGSVSRHHVRLTVCPNGITVEDLGSTNGITYLGKRIERATLMIGARLNVGSCTIDLLPLPETISMPLSTRESYGELVGGSLPMRKLYTSLEALENSDVSVLIEGETGTGKELVARALHEQGLRAGNPFVFIDCGSVPSNLMESELFGHRRGSFTGAVADRAGAFEVANGGTVFLDELGELPLELQPKLLRVLETGQVKRLGDTEYVPVDVRIIAATRRNLHDEVDAGRFREDLFYRVAVVKLCVPPLRQRREDIPLLTGHLATKISNGNAQDLPAEAEEMLLRHDWPGNVRELRNAIQRALALGIVDIGSISSKSEEKQTNLSPGEEGDHWEAFKMARSKVIGEFEHRYLKRLNEHSKGNLSAAAKLAGIDRKYLRELLKKHGIR